MQWIANPHAYALWQSNIAKTFAITSIPKNILVDRNGTIVALNIWDDDLQNFLTDNKLYQ